MKKTKIVVPALAVLLLSTAASVTGTVAWFSTNNSVKVDGMTVTTKVSSNLLIAETNEEGNYNESITQSRSAVIEPASTINGKNFYYTTSAKGDGDAKTDDYEEYSEATSQAHAAAGKSAYDATFNSAYGFAPVSTSNVSYAYVDYSFYIKATSAQDDQVLYMSKCNLTYKNQAGNDYEAVGAKDLAWRVGLLAVDTTANTAANDSNLALKTILGLDGAFNHNQKGAEVDTSGLTPNVDSVASYYLDPYGNQQASGTYQEGTKYYNAPSATPQAVKDEDELANVTNPGAAAQAATDIDAGATRYTRIIVRLWLEGEDITCTSNTYADLTRDWKLTLEFKLGNADDGAAQNPVLTGLKNIQSDPDLDD